MAAPLTPKQAHRLAPLLSRTFRRLCQSPPHHPHRSRAADVYAYRTSIANRYAYPQR